jgi:hypothetical protein
MAIIKSGTQGLAAEIPVKANAKAFLASVAALTKTASGTQVTVPIDVNVPKTSLAALRATIKTAISGVTSNISVGVSKPSLLALRSEIKASIDGVTSNVNVTVSKVSLAGLRRVIKAAIADVTGNINLSVSKSSLAALRAAIKGALSSTAYVAVAVSKASLAALRASIKAAVGGVTYYVQVGISKAQLAALRAQVKAALSGITPLVAGGGAGGAAAGGAAGAAAGGGRGRGGWLLGGLGGLTVGGVGALHVVFDLLLEAIIAVGSALVALGAGMLGLQPVAKDITTHLQSVVTVSEALNSNIRPLTGYLDQLGKAMAPQGIVLYGAGISILQSHMVALTPIVRTVVTMFTDWATNIQMWMNSQRGMGSLLKGTAGFLAQFGTILGNVLAGIVNLLHADPGIAHFWMNMLVGASRVFLAFSRLNPTLLKFTLALHGAFVVAGVLMFGLGRLLGPVIGLARGLGILSERGAVAARSLFTVQGALRALFVRTPIGVLALLAAEIGLIAYQSRQADKSVKNWLTGMEYQLGQLTASHAILQMNADIGKLNQAMKAQTVPHELATWGLSFTHIQQQLGAIGKAWTGVFTFAVKGGDILGGLAKLGNAFKTTFGFGVSRSAAAAQQVRNNMAAMNGEINKFLGSQKNLFIETGRLIPQFGSWNKAMAVMDLAGVKWNDSLATMRMKVNDLITGYKNLGVSGKMLANSVNVLTFAAQDAISSATKLNSAWDQFFGIISGGATGFIGFAQQMLGLNQALGISATRLSNSNGRVSLSLHGQAAAAAQAGTSLTGLSAKSLATQSTFLQTAQAANTEMDNLTLLAAAAGKAGHSHAMLAQATKDMVAQMLPAAKHSGTLTTVLYALAQRGGYQGADSFKALSSWVGKTRDPMQNLQQIVTRLTRAAGNLTTDVKNLSIALGQNLNQAMSKAIILASNAQPAMEAFAKAVLNTGYDTGRTRTAASAFAASLVKLMGNTKNAKAEFITFAMAGLHLTRLEADALWKNSLPAVTNALKNMHQPLHITHMDLKNMYADVSALIGKQWSWRTELNNDWKKLQEGKITRQQFINDLVTIGLKADISKGKLATLIAKILHIPKSEAFKLIMSGSGSYKIQGFSTSPSGGQSSLPHGIANPVAGKPRAMGILVPGHGSGDTVPAMLTPGEAVVPKHLVGAVAPFLKANRVPGFASGGFVGSGPWDADIFTPQGTGLIDTEMSAFRTQMQNSMVASMRAAIKQAAATAAQTFPGGLGRAGLRYLENLWMSAGGPGGGTAHVAAAIALAESGGSPIAHNPSGASGLWQILGQVVPGNIFNPYVNALNAVSKYRTAGGFSPWVTYTSGAYLHFMNKGGLVPGFAKGGVMDTARMAGGVLGRDVRFLRGHGYMVDLHGIPSGFKAAHPHHEPFKHMVDLVRAHGYSVSYKPDRHHGHGHVNPGGRDRSTVGLTAKDNRWINSVIGDALKDVGLPLFGYDKGGYLPPGKSLAVNNTGRPERVMPQDQVLNVRVDIRGGGPSAFDQAMIAWLRKAVLTHGGGNVQAALGQAR